MKNITPDFKNKVVSFSTDDSILCIVNPIFELQCKKLFVIGKVVKGSTTNDWAEGRPCAVAWDKVTDYMVFDSIEQYIELHEKSELN